MRDFASKIRSEIARCHGDEEAEKRRESQDRLMNGFVKMWQKNKRRVSINGRIYK